MLSPAWLQCSLSPARLCREAAEVALREPGFCAESALLWVERDSLGNWRERHRIQKHVLLQTVKRETEKPNLRQRCLPHLATARADLASLSRSLQSPGTEASPTGCLHLRYPFSAHAGFRPSVSLACLLIPIDSVHPLVACCVNCKEQKTWWINRALFLQHSQSWGRLWGARIEVQWGQQEPGSFCPLTQPCWASMQLVALLAWDGLCQLSVADQPEKGQGRLQASCLLYQERMHLPGSTIVDFSLSRRCHLVPHSCKACCRTSIVDAGTREGGSGAAVATHTFRNRIRLLDFPPGVAATTQYGTPAVAWLAWGWIAW